MRVLLLCRGQRNSRVFAFYLAELGELLERNTEIIYLREIESRRREKSCVFDKLLCGVATVPLSYAQILCVLIISSCLRLLKTAWKGMRISGCMYEVLVCLGCFSCVICGCL